MDNHARRIALPLSLIAAMLAFFTSMPASVLAQSTSRAPTDRTNAERARQQEMSSREMQLRTFGSPSARTSDPKKLAAIIAQIEEDFQRILILHNEIVRAVKNESAPYYGFVSDSTSEIKKRASRLQSTLALQVSDAARQNREKPIELNGVQLKRSLIYLCEHIQKFVTNPVIETPGTVDAQQLDKARVDLETVIELSGDIKKLAEKLKKTG